MIVDVRRMLLLVSEKCAFEFLCSIARSFTKKAATFTKQNATKKSGIQLKLLLIIACYFIVPLCHWIWLYGGLQNRVVMVNMLPILIGNNIEVNDKTIKIQKKYLN